MDNFILELDCKFPRTILAVAAMGSSVDSSLDGMAIPAASIRRTCTYRPICRGQQSARNTSSDVSNKNRSGRTERKVPTENESGEHTYDSEDSYSDSLAP